MYGISYENGMMRTRKKLSIFANEAVEDIFLNNDFAVVIGHKHAKAMSHDGLNIEHIKTVKKGNKA